MDATRNKKIIAASRKAWMESAKNCDGDPMDAACFAAVRAAYEIDGVGDLLERVDEVAGDGFSPGMGPLRAAAARVREAMGGQA